MNKYIKDRLLAAWETWEQFWFAADYVKQMDVFRQAFVTVLFCAYFVRTFDLSAFYSEHGFLRLSAVSEMMSGAWRFSVLNYFTSEVMLIVLNVLFLTSLLAIVFQCYLRVFTVIALILHVSFIHRNLGVTYGLDSLATYYLFYLCLAAAGTVKNKSSILGSVAFRLGQIQLSIIYMYSSLQKLKGSAWWQGDALWGVLANYQLTRADFSWVSGLPILLYFSCYAFLLWEIYFPVLVWVKPVRHWMLWMGFFVHLGIGLTMNLSFFAVAMWCVYILFLYPSELDWILTRLASVWGLRKQIRLIVFKIMNVDRGPKFLRSKFMILKACPKKVP